MLTMADNSSVVAVNATELFKQNLEMPIVEDLVYNMKLAIRFFGRNARFLLRYFATGVEQANTVPVSKLDWPSIDVLKVNLDLMVKVPEEFESLAKKMDLLHPVILRGTLSVLKDYMDDFKNLQSKLEWAKKLIDARDQMESFI
jgi:hypothetical protein